MKNNYFLEANFSLSEKPITATDIESLMGIKEQLIWLDLSNSQMNDDSLEKIGRLENLIKLNLSDNPISDMGIQHLAGLVNLESLNLYNTNVSERVLKILPKLTRLQKIYLWQTKINDSIVSQIQTGNKNLEVVFNREDMIDKE